MASRIPRDAIGDAWQADIVPFPVSFEDDPRARPTTLLVVSNGLVLATEMSSAPLGEPSDIADQLAKAIDGVRREADVSPKEIVVRWPEVAQELAQRLSGDVGIVVKPVLDDLVVPARELLKQVADFPVWPPVSHPDSWFAWGLPGPVLAALFEAAAAFHRAEPWRWLPSSSPLEAEIDGGGGWTVAVMGSEGIEFGLTMYELDQDYFGMFAHEETADIAARFGGRVIALGYTRLGNLPRTVQREVASHGWRVAAPHAYPLLLPMNTPAGGISRRDAADLIALLRAIPEFVSGRRAALEADAPRDEIEWVHPRTGTTLTLEPGLDDLWIDGVDDLLEDLVFVQPARGRPARQRGRRTRPPRTRPLRGSPEAGVTVLEDALRWIDGFPERYPVGTLPVVDQAKHLIREYAALHPDELARSMKPQLWAAGALHAAFHTDSRGVGGGTLARMFGVSSSAVNVRSRELRAAVARGPRPHRPNDDAPALDLWPSAAASEARKATSNVELDTPTKSQSPEPETAPRANAEPGTAAPAFTARQGQYLAFIHYYTKLHRQPPSEADLQRYFRVSPPTVHNMVVKLHENGLISRVPGQPRTMRVLLPREQLPDLE